MLQVNRNLGQVEQVEIRLRQLDLLMFSISPSILYDGNMLSSRLLSP